MMSSDAQSGQTPRSMLQMPRDECRALLEDRIQIGRGLGDTPISGEEELEQATLEANRWSNYNKELLRKLLNTNKFVIEYEPRIAYVRSGSFQNRLRLHRRYLDQRISNLLSIQERLPLIPEDPTITQPEASIEHKTEVHSNRVFVVHGRDEEALQSVARCIEKLGLDPIILREQPNRGRTVIEKFEDYSDVAYAVVLLTPDDVGRGKDESDLKLRARQNVIFELGFFIGKLGRANVCALYKEGVEIFSDYQGVLWAAMDQGDWRLKLVGELKAAGLDVDLDKLV